MSVVGSLIFCVECGNLLDNPSAIETAHIVCSQCDASYPKAKFSDLKVVTATADDAFPSALRSKRSVVKTSLAKNELDEGATIKEKCPQCGNDEMRYHTLQLRSADEGATVFYTCTSCGYRFRTNN
ncbi:LAFE_0C11804g1_1 [Lachancea fermentati]|uniref:DNA-directed RNA polymerase subunit n=1 Tax=Lachancea fermentati TaxID=4955 RepID=A0A1G4MA72_LACFM|nr:LAFE_0C11804g1_1 [Lachancea fermentati]